MSNQIKSKCSGCGTEAEFTASTVLYMEEMVQADKDFRDNHRLCTSSKNSRWTPNPCSREAGHSGPCNGWPCPPMMEKMAREIIEREVRANIGKLMPAPPGFFKRLFGALFK